MLKNVDEKIIREKKCSIIELVLNYETVRCRMNTYDINSNQYILEKLIGKALLDAAMWTNKNVHRGNHRNQIMWQCYRPNLLKIF